jgi:hypothetical protein
VRCSISRAVVHQSTELFISNCHETISTNQIGHHGEGQKFVISKFRCQRRSRSAPCGVRYGAAPEHGVLHQAVFLLGRFLASARRRCGALFDLTASSVGTWTRRPPTCPRCRETADQFLWDLRCFGSAELGVCSALGAGAWYGATLPTSACIGSRIGRSSEATRA